MLHCEGNDFPAHRAILCARSQGFKDKFNDVKFDETKQNGQYVLEITDIRGDILMHVLRYIYVGEMPSGTSPVAKEIYKTIQKYRVGCWSTSLDKV